MQTASQSQSYEENFEPLTSEAILGFDILKYPDLLCVEARPLTSDVFKEDEGARNLLGQNVLELVKLVADIGDGNCFFR